ncbi:toxin VasX [Oceanimonas baumannii]|uniref:Toxin VasX N-terminal region domain-containing protein n=1 Tax=Oceanimonas baumannii TaxID=129578 RepID=A0A235C9H1_9GAMM|nr:toxin VasX [Oceanimonas baumannii]OYD21074.1 hypothetical protein B6S09_17575 [Oceanimonas baumannii]TDW53979.1 hypothetical protein LY04_03551 [Oceanimonas baumannii]
MITDLKQLNDESIEHGKRRRVEYENHEGGELALTIPKREGGEIKITLLEHAQITDEQYDDYQLNTLLRLRPLAEMPPNEQYGSAGIGILRKGYLYVFFHGRLWRELEVDEHGRMSDVDLDHYRQCMADEQNDRPSSGVWLEDILVPVMLQGRSVMHDVRVGFSEIAWSWAYITWLELNPAKLEQRVQPVGHASAVVYSDELRFDNGFPAQKVSTLPELRAREPAAELMLENPSEQFTLDYTSPAANSLCGKLRSKWQFIADNAANAKSTDGAQEANQEELVSLTQMLEHQVEAGTDALATLKTQTGVAAVKIADPLFVLRHALTQIRLSFHYLDAIETSLSYKPLAHSAMLLRQSLFDRSAAKENEHQEMLMQLRQALDRKKLDDVLENEERRQTLDHIKIQINKLRSLLDSGAFEATLRDYASHHHLGVIESFSLAGALLHTLKQVPETVRKHGFDDNLGTGAILTGIFKNAALMAFWSPEDAEELMQQDLPPKGEIEPNDGSGRFRPNFIRSLVESGASLDEKALAALQMEGLALLAKQESARQGGDDSVQKTGKISSLIKAAIEGWSGAILASVQSLEKEGMITRIELHRLFSCLGASLKHVYQEFSGLRLLARDRVSLQQYSIIGVHGDGLRYGMTDAELASNHLTKKTDFLVGDILEEHNGTTKTAASTSPTTMHQADAGPVIKTSGSHSVFVIPPDHKMAKKLTATKINLANNINIRINSEGISKVFLGFALYNLASESKMLFKSYKEDRSLWLQGAKWFNAIIDSLAASMKLTEVILGDDNKLIKYGIQRPLFTVERTPLIGKRLAAVGGNTLVKTAALVNFAAGSIGVGISAYEVVNSLDNADYDAAFAHSVALAGGMVFLSSPLLATCLAIPGWGWAVLGMGLILGGGVWAAFATDGPLEKHLKLGPLGISPDASEVPDTDNDYYPQLLSLMSPFTINACRVADAPADNNELQTWLQNANHQPDDMMITLNSPLISQFPSWKSNGITITAQELKYSTLEASGTRASFLSEQTPLVNLKSSDFLPEDNAIRFVVGKQLKGGTHTTAYYRETYHLRLRVCIQARIKSELGEHVFPQPLSKKDLPYNPDKHASAPAKKTHTYHPAPNEQAPFWFIKEIDV